MVPQNSDPLRDSLTPDAVARLKIMDRVENVYFGTADDERVRKGLAKLIERMAGRESDNSPGKLRLEGSALVVTAPSQAGKSRLLNNAFRIHPAFPGYDIPESGCPAVTIGVPGSCTVKRLGLSIAEKLGYPLVTRSAQDRAWEIVGDRMQVLGVKILHLDEAHNVVRDTNVREAEAVRNYLKGLLVDKSRPISLVLSGTPELKDFIEKHPELNERSIYVTLDPLTEAHKPNLIKAVADLADVAGLSVATSEEELLYDRLMHASDNQFGRCLNFTKSAIDGALADRAPHLTKSRFADAYALKTSKTEVDPDFRTIG